MQDKWPGLQIFSSPGQTVTIDRRANFVGVNTIRTGAKKDTSSKTTEKDAQATSTIPNPTPDNYR